MEKVVSGPMDAVDSNLIVARLDGFLKAFEWINGKTNCVCTYFAQSLPAGLSAAEGLYELFDVKPSDFELQAITDLASELRATFNRFLFMYQEPDEDHLEDPKRSFCLTEDSSQTQLLDELVKLVLSMNVHAAWRLIPGSDPGALKEWCFQEDLLLVLTDQMCVLHLGVSD